MPKVYKRAIVERDLIKHYVHLAENGSPDIADRFLVNAETSFDMLAEQSGIGAPLFLRRPELLGLRKWRVDEFEKFLIFYQPRPDGVSIVRVLHAAQDWWSILGVAV